MDSVKKFINFDLKVACEIGVWKPDYLHLKDIINPEIQFILVEANKDCCKELELRYNLPNFKIYNFAIADQSGSIKLYNRSKEPDASAFIEGLPYSPATINDHYKINEKDIKICEGITFDKIDPGNIDLLCLDIEGAEWFALKHMKSMPKIITIEMHGVGYKNPYSKEIKDWMSKNKYEPIFYGQNDIFYLRTI